MQFKSACEELIKEKVLTKKLTSQLKSLLELANIHDY